MLTLVGAAVAVLAGALVRGFTGFGASMFWVASLTLIYAPATVVPTVLALEVIASLVLAPTAWRDVHWRSMNWLLFGTIATTPLGILLLTVIPDKPMRAVVAVAVLAGTVALALGAGIDGTPDRPMAFAAGTACGVINGSTGIGGPPAVLLYFSGTTEAQVSRSTLIVYFLATDAVAFGMLGVAGLIDPHVWWQTLVMAPLAIAGILAGQWLFGRSGGRNLRPMVLITLAALSISVLVRLILVG